MIVWLIGLSGSGKSTLAKPVYESIRETHPNTVLLDGDQIREVFGQDQKQADYSVEGRRINAHRISHLCKMLDEQGINVVAAVLSIFPEWQAWNRAEFSRYHEIFLDVPVETAAERDPKGIYSAADGGKMPNVVGLDIPFPKPEKPDLVLNRDDQLMGVPACVQKILSSLPALD